MVGARLIATGIFLSATAFAAELPPHVRAVGGGWYDCDPGFVMTAGRCLSDAEIAARPKFEVSPLPSAGDGARDSSSSAPAIVYQEYRSTFGGWTYIPPQFANQGGELVRPNGFGRAHVQLPFPY